MEIRIILLAAGGVVSQYHSNNTDRFSFHACYRQHRVQPSLYKKITPIPPLRARRLSSPKCVVPSRCVAESKTFSGAALYAPGLRLAHSYCSLAL